MIDSGRGWVKRGAMWASRSSSEDERVASFALTLVVSLVIAVC